jgi:hypothetical protein
MEHQNPIANSDHSSNSLDKEIEPISGQHLEVIRTVSKVPGNDHYYEKDGLRTYGDDEDHDHEPPVSQRSGFPWNITLTVDVDDLPPLHVLSGYGFPVDGISNTSISLW